jgi:DNA topoisomerase VI subunit B
MNTQLQTRDTFSTPISTDFTTKKGLTSSTGQEPHQFGGVILKELLDNSIDACESAGVNPEITIGYEHDGTFATYCVADNGNGLSKETIEKILDFDTRTSDKAAMKSPSRGAQGNAFKTILGIPNTCDGYVIIESLGFSHRIKINATESMMLPPDYDVAEIPLTVGTAVKVIMKRERSDEGLDWAQRFAVFNPHIRVKIGYIENLKNTC